MNISIQRVCTKVTVFCFFTFFLSCEEPIVLTHIPADFTGNWLETSDDIILEREHPKTIFLKNKSIKILHTNYDNEKFIELNKIKTIAQEGKNKLVITCLKDETLTTEITLIMKDGFLHVSEFIHSGVSDSEGVYGRSAQIGKFYQTKDHD